MTLCRLLFPSCWGCVSASLACSLLSCVSALGAAADLIGKCIGEEAKYEGIRLLFDGMQQPVLNKQVTQGVGEPLACGTGLPEVSAWLCLGFREPARSPLCLPRRVEETLHTGWQGTGALSASAVLQEPP